jgi:hypothetical protein
MTRPRKANLRQRQRHRPLTPLAISGHTSKIATQTDPTPIRSNSINSINSNNNKRQSSSDHNHHRSTPSFPTHRPLPHPTITITDLTTSSTNTRNIKSTTFLPTINSTATFNTNSIDNTIIMLTIISTRATISIRINNIAVMAAFSINKTINFNRIDSLNHGTVITTTRDRAAVVKTIGTLMITQTTATTQIRMENLKLEY